MLATLLLLGAPSKSAQAQAPDPTPSAITLFKECDGLSGTFEFLLNLEFEPDNIPEDVVQVDEDTVFDFTVQLECGVPLILEAGDELAAALAWGADPDVQEVVTEGTMFIEEQNLPDGTLVTFADECVDTEPDGIGEIDIIDESGELGARFVAEGFLCIITNTFVEEPAPELAGLIVHKVCVSGDGDGDADFHVLVTQLLDLIDMDALDCGEVMVATGLAPGGYTLTEVIVGPDANLFATAIVCSDGQGQAVTPGTKAEVSLVAGMNTECAVLNFFNPPAESTAPGAPDGTNPGSAPSVLVPVIITNTNTNNGTVVNSNSNEGGNNQTLDNQNIEENDNINDNTQRQTVTRSQTNSSSQE